MKVNLELCAKVVFAIRRWQMLLSILLIFQTNFKRRIYGGYLNIGEGF